MAEKVVFLLDGGFVKKKIEENLHHFPTFREVVDLCAQIQRKPPLDGKEIFRLYYYDAPPFEGNVQHPLTGANVNFSNTPFANQNKALIDSLELEPDFAVRRGVLKCSGWKLGRTALRRMMRTPQPHTVAANDFVPNMQQKGVDMRIGLDIAWIALKKQADIMVLVTGDSDFVPVIKFARREGMRVFLEHLSHPVSRELKAHVDRVLAP